MKFTLNAIDCIKKNVEYHGIVAAASGPGRNGEEYRHIWPRDSFFVGLELLKWNKPLAEEILLRTALLPTFNGILYQRYELNGLPDSSAWCNEDGRRQLDQDALKFIAFARIDDKHTKYKMSEDFLKFVERIKLKESATDVWEQKQGYFFYTTATVLWALQEGEKYFGLNLTELKKELLESLNYYWDEKQKSFVKSPFEKILDLEVVIGLNILLENGLFNDKEFMEKAFSTLEAVERELAIKINGVKVPLRYKQDFWNGEVIGEKGSGEAWPMGCLFLSQAYSHIAELSLKQKKYGMSAIAGVRSRQWLSEFEKLQNSNEFPEQVDLNGIVRDKAPKQLSWCAGEYLKAKRLNRKISG